LLEAAPLGGDTTPAGETGGQVAVRDAVDSDDL
jgi:hypothetical protein